MCFCNFPLLMAIEDCTLGLCLNRCSTRRLLSGFRLDLDELLRLFYKSLLNWCRYQRFLVATNLLVEPINLKEERLTHILHLTTVSRGYTDKTRLRGFQTLDFL